MKDFYIILPNEATKDLEDNTKHIKYSSSSYSTLKQAVLDAIKILHTYEKITICKVSSVQELTSNVKELNHEINIYLT